MNLLRYDKFIVGTIISYLVHAGLMEAGIELSELIKLIETLFASDRIEGKSYYNCQGVYERKKEDFGKNKKYKEIEERRRE